MDATRTLQKLIESDYRIAALDTPEADRVLGVFKRLTLTTGRAVYDWTPDSGLYRLGIEHIFIPRTRAPADVMAYVASSRHYGIYLLREFHEPLVRGSVQKSLLQVADNEDGVRRLVILMGQDLTIPEVLSGKVAVMRHNVRTEQPEGRRAAAS